MNGDFPVEIALVLRLTRLARHPVPASNCRRLFESHQHCKQFIRVTRQQSGATPKLGCSPQGCCIPMVWNCSSERQFGQMVVLMRRKAREMGAFSVGTPTVFAGVSRNRDLDNAALSLEVGTAKRLSGNPLLPIAPAIHRSQSSCQFTKRDHEAVVEQRS